MPEEPEVQTENISEPIHEALEREGGRLLKAVALTTTLLATVAAVAALLASATVNEALILKTEASRLQTEVADQWAYYQAKGIKAAVKEASRAAWVAVGKEPPAEYEADVKRYGEEQAEIQKVAREKERERDGKSAEADHLFHRHHDFAISVTIFQVAIALGAVAALTRIRPIWIGSLVLGMGGLGLLLSTLLR